MAAACVTGAYNRRCVTGFAKVSTVGGLPGIFSKNMQKNRYQGHLYGGGISVGHSWILKKRWSIEASVGLGYARIEYEKYPCAECGSKLKDTGRNYFGPTKAALSIIYLIK